MVSAMFNQSNSLRSGSSTTSNPMQDFEVVSPPDDSISSLAFSPASIQQNFLVAGSWDCNVRCWEVEQSGKTVPKSMQSMAAPVFDVCWSDVSPFPPASSFVYYYLARKKNRLS